MMAETAEEIREAIATVRRDFTGGYAESLAALRTVLSAAATAAADRERAEKAERIIGPDADPCEGCADEWEDDSHPGSMTCRTNCERWTAYRSGLRGQLAVAKLDAATAWTAAHCCAEAEKQQRARADVKEQDAKRWQMVRERYVMVSASPVSWVPSGTAYCEGELDIVADVLAAQSTPDAGRD